MPSKSSDPDRVRQYLADMIVSIDRIDSYIDGMSEEAFARDQKTVDAVVRNLEIIGEASKHIPPHLQVIYTAAPWRVLGDLRNRAIHEYRGLSPTRVYRTVADDLPGLRDALVRMTAQLPPSSDA